MVVVARILEGDGYRDSLDRCPPYGHMGHHARSLLHLARFPVAASRGEQCPRLSAARRRSSVVAPSRAAFRLPSRFPNSPVLRWVLRHRTTTETVSWSAMARAVSGSSAQSESEPNLVLLRNVDDSPEARHVMPKGPFPLPHEARQPAAGPNNCRQAAANHQLTLMKSLRTAMAEGRQPRIVPVLLWNRASIGTAVGSRMTAFGRNGCPSASLTGARREALSPQLAGATSPTPLTNNHCARASEDHGGDAWTAIPRYTFALVRHKVTLSRLAGPPLVGW